MQPLSYSLQMPFLSLVMSSHDPTPLSWCRMTISITWNHIFFYHFTFVESRVTTDTLFLTLAILQMLHARHIFKHPNLCFFMLFISQYPAKVSSASLYGHSSGQGCACMLPIAAATLILVSFLRTPVCTCLALVMLGLAGSGLAVVFMSPADGLRRQEVDFNSGERSQACGQMLSA